MWVERAKPIPRASRSRFSISLEQPAGQGAEVMASGGSDHPCVEGKRKWQDQAQFAIDDGIDHHEYGGRDALAEEFCAPVPKQPAQQEAQGCDTENQQPCALFVEFAIAASVEILRE